MVSQAIRGHNTLKMLIKKEISKETTVMEIELDLRRLIHKIFIYSITKYISLSMTLFSPNLIPISHVRWKI